ncbi:MAG: AraC family transcriptional regulator [Roseburia sp.]|nr:AraC family transcriptional regulator [Roseburia sp.]MCM1097078.1 AraC family transcriptional regulator [Ruminococcus flavefaciens]
MDRISTTWGIVCCMLGKDKETVLYMSHADDAAVLGEANPEIRRQIISDAVSDVRSRWGDRALPVFLQDGKQVNYFAFPYDEELLFLAGPFAFEEISFEETHQFRKRHGIRDKEYRVPIVELKAVLNCMVFSFYLLTGNQITEDEILADNEFNSLLHKKDVLAYEMNRQTEEEARLSYEYERQWLASVENGTVVRSNMHLNEENLQKIKKVGNLADKDGYKQIEYMVISAVTLACRAAIRGGLNPYDAYHVADLYFQQVAKSHSIMEMLNIYMNTMQDFSERVRRVNENRQSSDVEKCKDYIARNRTKKFTLYDLAENVGKNPSYLSDKFSKEVGMTIQEYTKRQRLEAAANMLVYSDTGIGDIAEYLHFSSQSYFGVCFKAYYYMTPAKYREKHRVIDFDEKASKD